MNTLLVVRFWYTLAALVLGVAVVTLTLLLGQERHRRLALAYAAFLSSIWIILLSFALETFGVLVGAPNGWRVLTLVVNGTGSITYLLAAPLFYHSVLGLPIGPRFALVYRFVGGVIVAGVALLFVPTMHRAALTALNAFLFAVILYGIVLIALGYRRITERSLRRAIAVFVVLAGVFFPLMLLESAPWAGDRVTGAAIDFALPTFFGALAALSIPFALRRLNRPAFWTDNSVTPHFAAEFGLSEREREVVDKLCTGLSNRRIAEELFISPKTVENHLSNIFVKTGVHSRMQLITLLLANQ